MLFSSLNFNYFVGTSDFFQIYMLNFTAWLGFTSTARGMNLGMKVLFEKVQLAVF